MSAAELDQLGHAGHRAVVVHDLADHAGGPQAGEAGEVDRALGLAGAHEHAALAGAQREDVARGAPDPRAGVGVDGDADGRARSAALMPVVTPFAGLDAQ